MQPVHVEKLYAGALQKTRCAGKHHPRIKQMFALRNNTKPNPHKFCVDVRVPMFSDITDSLNVGIATTMILYEMGLRQRGILKRR
jgi:tRNA(Leu) C34 or U34 (ribose-2'-O)-methylase TrmL